MMDKFVIVDIETPYSFCEYDGIREVAALAIENYEIIDTLHLAKIYDAEAYKQGYGFGLHAIEEDKKFIKSFKKFIKKYDFPLVAHYAPFERRFLRHWGWIEENQDLYCTMRAIKHCVKDLDSYSMFTLLNHFNVKENQTHTAIQDVLDLLEILKIVKPQTWIPVGVSYAEYDPEYEKQIRLEKKQRLDTAKNNVISDKLNGKKIVFTGAMTYDRTTMMEIAIKHGAITPGAISKDTSLLVVGSKPGSKLKKAIEYGTEIMSEEDFAKLINYSSVVRDKNE